ncbi:MAG: UTP--glucose-1-phosphate uridylyltransferase, partial [Clostridiales bacterium]|nr:UTP--glucose-1-phosphate uridylyltransferase [Clostridiales bacterium]
DGNGGVFISLAKSGILDRLAEGGVKWVNIVAVDNALIKPADAVFVGFTSEFGVCAAVKSVLKKFPQEKIGVFCLKNKRPAVVEYSEISDEMRDSVNKSGNPLYGDANIGNYLFNIDILKKAGMCGMPYHRALKKGRFFVDGVFKEMEFYKYETFIFDIYEYIPELLVYRVSRQDEFAPVKNRTGSDSPEEAIKMYMDARNI